MNLFKIAFSNIKKRKAGMITLLLMIIIASLILMIGLNLLFGLNGYFQKKVDELNSSHFAAYISDNVYSEEKYEFVKNYEGVDIYETEDILRRNDLDMDMNGTTFSTMISFHSINFNRKIAPLKIIDKLSVEPADAVVAPLFVKLNGLKSGDTLKIGEYSFTIYGFFEDAEFGSSGNSMKRVYVPEAKIIELSSDEKFIPLKFLTVRFDDISMAKQFSMDFGKVFYGTYVEIFWITAELSDSAGTVTISLISVFVLLFALIILIISLIVVRFNINNNIEDDIKNFGALKSAGYTTKQIVLSLIIQYLIIAVAACVLGAVLSILAMPLVGNIVTSNSGLLWITGFQIMPLVASVFSILIITALTAYFTGRKTKRITPVNALRSGLSAHNFKKNRVAMSKNKLPLHLNLGIKNLFNNIKNNITVFLVVLLFVFASCIGLTFQHNLSSDTEAIMAMVSIDPYPTAVFYGDDFETDIEMIANDIERVEKVIYLDNISISHEDANLQLYIYKDFGEKKYDNCYQGRYPKNGEEIAISGGHARSINKKLGGTIKLSIRGEEKEFTIVGLTQSLSNFGLEMFLTFEGMKRFDEDYEIKSIGIILKDDSLKSEFISDFNENFIGKAEILDAEKMIDEMANSLAATFDMVSLLIIMVAAIVISLLLYLLISTLIRKNKKNLGIQKATGYSNWQLIRQMIYTFMPVIIIAVIVGFIVSLLMVNPAMTLALSSAGLISASFKFPYFMSIILIAGIALLSFIIVTLVSLRIRKISAIKLIVE